MPNLGDMTVDLEESYTDDYELLAVLKSVRADILNLHKQACEVGMTDEVYTPLAKMIDALKEQAE